MVRKGDKGISGKKKDEGDGKRRNSSNTENIKKRETKQKE